MANIFASLLLLLDFCGGRTPVWVPDLPHLHHVTSSTPVPGWQSGQLIKLQTIKYLLPERFLFFACFFLPALPSLSFVSFHVPCLTSHCISVP